MTTNPNCFNCRHSQITKQQQDGTLNFQQRICVESPPQIVIIPAPQGVLMQSVFPIVVQGMLCDRHNPAPVLQAETPVGSG